MLGPQHAEQVARVLRADPVSACLVAARYEIAGMDPVALGGQFWGIAGGRDGLCYAGSTMVPLAGDAAALRAFATMAGRRGRRCATILGPAALVLPIWERLESRWGPAREVRADQPLLVCPDPPLVDPDPLVEVVDLDRLDPYFPAAVAMFTEEVGVDPRAGDGGHAYRERVAELIRQRRAFARFHEGKVVYKAEIGALSRSVALIQGVWVDPQWRGKGLAAAGTAAVVRAVQRDFGRLASLYVNDHNAPARAAYRRAGFHQVGTFASVLF
nr:GNAT family N-acetyltransferase [Nakamurella leprariae]